MFRWGVIVLVAALVAGCTTAGSYPIRSRYHGVHIDLFFLENGAPVASHALDFGGTEFLWYSNRDSAYKPGFTDSDLIGNTAWWEGYRDPDYDPRLHCGVRIVTDPYGYIREIRIHRDSRAWWEGPRCYQVFGPAITG